jgi:hypothetical protein
VVEDSVNSATSNYCAIIETVHQLGFELLQHPPNSPDLAPSDYHIFGPLKEALRGRGFASDEKVKEAVHTSLREQPKSFFSRNQLNDITNTSCCKGTVYNSNM